MALALQVQHHHEESHEESSNAGFEPLKDIYALGDCCANVEGPLPSLAQVCKTAIVQSSSLILFQKARALGMQAFHLFAYAMLYRAGT